MLYTGSLVCAMIWGLSESSQLDQRRTHFICFRNFRSPSSSLPDVKCVEICHFMYFRFSIFCPFFKKLLQLGESLWFLLFHLGWKQKSRQCLLTSLLYIPHFL